MKDFKYLLYIIYIIFDINHVLPMKFESIFHSTSIANSHGILIGHFTFTGKGIAGVSYSMKPFINSSSFKLYVFPMAYDPYTNLKILQDYYSQASCKDFYRKAIYIVNITKTYDKVSLGRFSGGFAVAVVLSNKYVCPPNLKRLDFDEKLLPETIETKIELLNPDELGLPNNQLSATDQGIYEAVQILFVLYFSIILWILYSIVRSTSVDIRLMVTIQRLASLISIMHIVIYSILLINYSRLSETGTIHKNMEIIAEIMSLACRYIEMYIVISWTLSSQRDSGRSSDTIFRIIGGCAVFHIMLTVGHYCLLTKESLVYNCLTVWDCESHVFTMGFGNPIRYNSTEFGWILFGLNWITNLVASLFVLHLLKLGFSINEFSMRRTYVSLFCSTSFLWFWSYPIFWFLSGLMVDYFQYKFVLFLVSISHFCAIPAVIRVTISPKPHTEFIPESVSIYN